MHPVVELTESRCNNTHWGERYYETTIESGPVTQQKYHIYLILPQRYASYVVDQEELTRTKRLLLIGEASSKDRGTCLLYLGSEETLSSERYFDHSRGEWTEYKCHSVDLLDDKFEPEQEEENIKWLFVER